MHYEVTKRPDSFVVEQVKLGQNGWKHTRVISGLTAKKANAICNILNKKDSDL
jgi:hypothetical protein